MVAIRCSGTLTMLEGERRADALIAAVPSRSWQKISAGAGAHGPREYHWAPGPGPDRLGARPRALAAGPPVAKQPGRDRLLRLLRSPPVQHRRPGLGRGQPLAYRRCFQQAKGEAGLDHCQVRPWRAWYAHITLSMLALAWLAASRAQAVKKGSVPATPV